eukprot:2764720-Amphidinium_carterae.1
MPLEDTNITYVMHDVKRETLIIDFNYIEHELKKQGFSQKQGDDKKAKKHKDNFNSTLPTLPDIQLYYRETNKGEDREIEENQQNPMSQYHHLQAYQMISSHLQSMRERQSTTTAKLSTTTVVYFNTPSTRQQRANPTNSSHNVTATMK